MRQSQREAGRIPFGRDVVFSTVPGSRSRRVFGRSRDVCAGGSGSGGHWGSRSSEMGKAGETLVSGDGVSSRSSNNGRHGAEGEEQQQRRRRRR
jgi:hypothetical protein